MLSAHSGRVVLACQHGAHITVDFDRDTVTDSTSDTPAPAVIGADSIKWHSEFNAYQFDPHYGGQVVHHTADRTLDRHTGKLDGVAACDPGQN